MKARPLRIESVIEVALTAGIVLSSVLFVLGLGFSSPPLLKAGVLLLMLTPVARVVILTAGLLRERDYFFGLVSLFVLGVLLSGMAVSAHLGPPPSTPASAPGGAPGR
jgi:uncharacterized membrane protein